MKRIFKSIPFPSGHDAFISLLEWANQKYDHITFLTSNNGVYDKYSAFETILAVGAHEQICPDEQADAFNALKQISDKTNDWLFGFLSYDLKNQSEELISENNDGINMPLMHFFRPIVLFIFRDDKVSIGILEAYTVLFPEITELLNNKRTVIREVSENSISEIIHKVNHDDYLRNVFAIKKHIQQGDIYEMNYCIEFFSNDAKINPVEIYSRLNSDNPTPFSCFYKYFDKYLMSSTPERFLAKRGKKLISQPIKGTIKRGSNPKEDELLKTQLFSDPKERSENVMIVDLVRNDLAHSALPGSVVVEELFGVYTYPKVHQMISTVTAELRDDVHFADAIRNAFPMGSMTGAPKIKAMQLIDKYEKTRRGLYSGAVGYISPGKNFDFNVIIRSILYNSHSHYISFMAGSAITSASEHEKEYTECLLKAEAMARALGTKL